MTARARRRSRGFTLIEVLVALAIVVVGVGALLATLSSAADTTAYLRDKTFAQWVGFNQIAAVRLALQPVADGTSEGDVDYAGRKWHYQQEVQPLQLPGMRRIDVHVVLVPPGAEPPKDSWTTTVSSILGAAIASPTGILPDWDNGSFAGRPAPAPAGAANAAGGATTGTGGATTGTGGGTAGTVRGSP
jgi:general secretion pathway protein I